MPRVPWEWYSNSAKEQSKHSSLVYYRLLHYISIKTALMLWEYVVYPKVKHESLCIYTFAVRTLLEPHSFIPRNIRRQVYQNLKLLFHICSFLEFQFCSSNNAPSEWFLANTTTHFKSVSSETTYLWFLKTLWPYNPAVACCIQARTEEHWNFEIHHSFE